MAWPFSDRTRRPTIHPCKECIIISMHEWYYSQAYIHASVQGTGACLPTQNVNDNNCRGWMCIWCNLANSQTYSFAYEHKMESILGGKTDLNTFMFWAKTNVVCKGRAAFSASNTVICGAPDHRSPPAVTTYDLPLTSSFPNVSSWAAKPHPFRSIPHQQTHRMPKWCMCVWRSYTNQISLILPLDFTIYWTCHTTQITLSVCNKKGIHTASIWW